MGFTYKTYMLFAFVHLLERHEYKQDDHNVNIIVYIAVGKKNDLVF